MNNKTIYKWFSMLLLMMVAGISSATAQSLAIDDFSIKAGETKDVAVSLVAENTIYGIQTDVTLSEGLTLAATAAVDTEMSFSQNEIESGVTRVSMLSLTGKAIAAGEVIKLTVTAANDFTAGTITLADTRLTTSTTGTEFKAADVTANVTLEEPSGPTDNQIYLWAGGNEVGGTAVATDGVSVGFANSTFTTIRLNGKADYSTDYVTITLDTPLKAGDKINITAYRNKNETQKKSAAKIAFDAEGTTYVTTGDGYEFININEAVNGTEEYGTEPNTVTVEVPADAAGSTMLKLTRAQTQTNLFITQLEIISPAEEVLQTFTATFTTNAAWEKVYAYAWSGVDPDVTEFFGGWPGRELTATDGIYTVTIEAKTAPEFIVFSNGNTGYGNQTEDLTFEDGKAYVYNVAPPVEPIIPDGTYYVMSANEGTLINAENALDAKGTPITFTFDAATNTYTIEGADFFTGKQWTIADAAEGMSGFYTISTAEGFLAVSATMTLEQIADGTDDAAVWILLQKSYWEDIVNSTYTIAGTKNLTGTENDWDIVEANQMVLNEETGLFEKKFKKIAIDGENQPEFKVVQTNMAGENIWYPENNWVITTDYVGGEGLYDITITFDPSDFKEVDVIAEKRIVFPENAIVYDFEAAADAGENPANKNGSAANGQAFYGWENPEKTDNKRQDYKGYEWAEGSVLPEVCHVWRRSDRINGNVAGNDGLKCPSNKEMAIDGLDFGDKVIIVYDAENATDKEIIWAIGDGTSDGGPGVVRATATINGVEAVTGETTIASGAEIVVNSVTPAENGSGYIVFQVKKGMVIKQIAVVPAPDYYLVGTMTNWADEGVKEDYKLTLNTEAAEGVEEYTITLDLTTADQFKIVKKDGETLTWYPSEGNNYGQNGEITEDANYTVYFRPNGDGGADWFYGCIYVVSNKVYEPIIPDGTYYALNAVYDDPELLIASDGTIKEDGYALTFTFDNKKNAYTIEGSNFFAGKQWIIEGEFVYTISTVIDGVKKYVVPDVNKNLTFTEDGLVDEAWWAFLIADYWEEMQTYTVAGTKDLTGTENDFDVVAANDMEQDESGLFVWEAQDIDVTNDAMPSFKIVANNAVWYPAGGEESNWVITPTYLGGEGKYDITITFNARTKEIGVTGTYKGAPTGINTVNFADQNIVIYNIKGQKVTKTQKGLYIINGKKQVLK